MMSLRLKQVCNFARLEGTWLFSAIPTRLAIFGLLLSAVFPSLSRAQAPVFEIIPLESTTKFELRWSSEIAWPMGTR